MRRAEAWSFVLVPVLQGRIGFDRMGEGLHVTGRGGQPTQHNKGLRLRKRERTCSAASAASGVSASSVAPNLAARASRLAFSSCAESKTAHLFVSLACCDGRGGQWVVEGRRRQ
jgi:hypothetical protein